MSKEESLGDVEIEDVCVCWGMQDGYQGWHMHVMLCWGLVNASSSASKAILCS